ncbi:MAG: hypothetical protein H6740_21785, partial [Alphaproteobacteria bacterium]|nr:hypothetical protein [Alphaproteobacteria bacterium]
MKLLPLGPFPPRGSEPQGCVDLGVRLRDSLLTAAELRGPTRGALAAQLQAAVKGERWAEAAVLLEAVLDTWPLSALVDPARKAWARGARDATDLAVLARAASLISLARGWAPFGRGPWPTPDTETLRRLSQGASVALRRGPGDGAALVAEALGLPLSDDEALPEGLAVLSDADVLERRDALARALVAGRVRAVAWRGEGPTGAEAQLAWGELQMEAPDQEAFE